MEKTIAKKKLLITASTFPRWDGDTEPRFILDLAKALLKYYDVTVLAPMTENALEQEDMEGVHVVRYHYFPIHKLETLCYPGAIVPRIKEKKIRIFLVPCLFAALYFKMKRMIVDYDLIHANWIIPQGIVQSNFDKKYIVTGHGGDVTSLNVPIIKQMKRKCLKNASAITVVSDVLKAYVMDMYPNSKTSVVSMGCNTKNFSPSLREENYFAQGEKKVILFVGRLAEVKGITYLIEAMQYIDNAVLHIVGKGNLGDDLRAQAEPLQDKVVFDGAKTHEELPTIYASADVFVAPSVTAKDGGKEGFGLVILEAMSSGVPVVASNSGGIPNIIQHQKNGLLTREKDVLDIAEKINLILNDDNLKENLVEQGSETAKSFDYETIAEKYRDIYEGV